jgi:hypothetical protein
VSYGDAVQALLPVWLIVVGYKQKKYLVGVNGQTGKVAVNLPIDKKKESKLTRKETTSDILMTLSVFAVIVVVLGIGFVHEGIDITKINWSAVGAGDAAFVITIVVLLLAMLVVFAVAAFRAAKRKVKDSMHNVAEASDADAFIEEGNLDITFSAKKKGPKQSEDNWPPE